MKWNRFTIKTKTDAEDMIICTLAEIGVEGAEIQDHQPLTEEDKAQMFVDIMPEGPEDDGVAYLNFYLEEDADKDVILRDVRNALEELRTFMDIGVGGSDWRDSRQGILDQLSEVVFFGAVYRNGLAVRSGVSSAVSGPLAAGVWMAAGRRNYLYSRRGDLLLKNAGV